MLEILVQSAARRLSRPRRIGPRKCGNPPIHLAHQRHRNERAENVGSRFLSLLQSAPPKPIFVCPGTRIEAQVWPGFRERSLGLRDRHRRPNLSLMARFSLKLGTA